MATPLTSSAKYWLGALGTFIVLALAWIWWSWPPPQMGYDKDAFAAVDALFTAINARDPNMLGHCEQRLETLAQRGRISQAATSRLSEIVASARSGDWERSGRNLYYFMLAQRRDTKPGAGNNS